MFPYVGEFPLHPVADPMARPPRLCAQTATQRRGGGQDQGPDEIADGSSARPPLTAQAWVHW